METAENSSQACDGVAVAATAARRAVDRTQHYTDPRGGRHKRGPGTHTWTRHIDEFHRNVCAQTVNSGSLSPCLPAGPR